MDSTPNRIFNRQFTTDGFADFSSGPPITDTEPMQTLPPPQRRPVTASAFAGPMVINTGDTTPGLDSSMNLELLPTQNAYSRLSQAQTTSTPKLLSPQSPQTQQETLVSTPYSAQQGNLTHGFSVPHASQRSRALSQDSTPSGGSASGMSPLDETPRTHFQAWGGQFSMSAPEPRPAFIHGHDMGAYMPNMRPPIASDSLYALHALHSPMRSDPARYSTPRQALNLHSQSAISNSGTGAAGNARRTSTRAGEPQEQFHLRKQRKDRKPRTPFSPEQLKHLENVFKKQKYITIEDRSQIATELGLLESQVKIWFQNRRAKSKRMQEQEMASSRVLGVSPTQAPTNSSLSSVNGVSSAAAGSATGPVAAATAATNAMGQGNPALNVLHPSGQFGGLPGMHPASTIASGTPSSNVAVNVSVYHQWSGHSAPPPNQQQHPGGMLPASNLTPTILSPSLMQTAAQALPPQPAVSNVYSTQQAVAQPAVNGGYSSQTFAQPAGGSMYSSPT